MKQDGRFSIGVSLTYPIPYLETGPGIEGKLLFVRSMDVSGFGTPGWNYLGCNTGVILSLRDMGRADGSSGLACLKAKAGSCPLIQHLLKGGRPSLGTSPIWDARKSQGSLSNGRWEG